jgi:hypothetical protein
MENVIMSDNTEALNARAVSTRAVITTLCGLVDAGNKKMAGLARTALREGFRDSSGVARNLEVPVPELSISPGELSLRWTHPDKSGTLMTFRVPDFVIVEHFGPDGRMNACYMG